jgi:hypothetical protein
MPPTIITALTAQPATGLIQAASYGRGAFELNASTPIARKTKFDYDGDGKADVSVIVPKTALVSAEFTNRILGNAIRRFHRQISAG